MWFSRRRLWRWRSPRFLRWHNLEDSHLHGNEPSGSITAEVFFCGVEWLSMSFGAGRCMPCHSRCCETLDWSLLLLRWASNSRQLAVLQLASKERGISWLLTEASDSNWSMLGDLAVRQSIWQKKEKCGRPKGQALSCQPARCRFYLLDIYILVRICHNCFLQVCESEATKGRIIRQYVILFFSFPLFSLCISLSFTSLHPFSVNLFLFFHFVPFYSFFHRSSRPRCWHSASNTGDRRFMARLGYLQLLPIVFMDFFSSSGQVW
jgi:hypothetical protein